MARDNFYRERAWIKSKYAKGVSKNELLSCVGVFSNKKKSRVMSEKIFPKKNIQNGRVSSPECIFF